MEQSQKNFGIAFLILILGLGIWYSISNKNNQVFKVLSEDDIASWETQKLGGISEEELKEKISDLENKASQTQDPEELYNVWIELSQNYRYLGDGEKSFEALNEALLVSSDKAIAYLSMGALLNEVGATQSARLAYETGVSKEPQFSQFQLQLIDFLRFTPGIPDEDVEAAFEEGLARTGNSTNILREYAIWLGDKDRNQEAIEAWEMLLLQNPNNREQIEARINSLR
ncbi:hypothetical protein CL654_03255 [bacterium]|nr:hypothetical protein [bacterium]|tara:strand:+ start:2958 stop:3641 length:684 start_codon:yes stop_codon:yes gene_type:complete